MLITTEPGPPRAEPGGRLRSLRGVFTRYTIGSVLAAVASEAVLLLTFGTHLLGATGASIAGWAAGAMLNYTLNRRWAWGRQGRASFRRELLPYWAIALASMALSAGGTKLVARLTVDMSDGVRLILVGSAFLGVYGLMFVVKFVLFHYLVFAGEPATDGAGRPARPRRSRHQVPSTTLE